MSTSAGMCARAGNHGNADPLEFIRGVLTTDDHDPVYADDYWEPADARFRQQLRDYHENRDAA